MKNVSPWNLALPVFMLSYGFILVGAVSGGLTATSLSPQQILEQAKQTVSLPDYPLPPLGATTAVEATIRRICTYFPTISGMQVNINLKCNNVTVPVTVNTGPSSVEALAWESKVDVIGKAYDLALQTQASVIAERQRTDMKSYVRDMVQIGIGIFGAIFAVGVLVIGSFKSHSESHETGADTAEPPLG